MHSLKRPSGVQIVAGGYGTRLREVMDGMGYDERYPKHLLPTGGPHGETVLGRIVRQSLGAPTDGPVVIHANRHNAPSIFKHPDIDRSVSVRVGDYPNFLMPFLTNLLEFRKRTLGCAGDFYADFSWDEVIASHEDGQYPVTFMAGRTVAIDHGLTFDVSDAGKIERMKRAERTSSEDLVNIGVYVFDPQEPVLGALESLIKSRQAASASTIANRLISEGLVGAYVVPGTPYNVNTGETYAALLEHTRKVPLAGSEAIL